MSRAPVAHPTTAARGAPDGNSAPCPRYNPSGHYRREIGAGASCRTPKVRNWWTPRSSRPCTGPTHPTLACRAGCLRRVSAQLKCVSGRLCTRKQLRNRRSRSQTHQTLSPCGFQNLHHNETKYSTARCRQSGGVRRLSTTVARRNDFHLQHAVSAAY